MSKMNDVRDLIIAIGGAIKILPRFSKGLIKRQRLIIEIKVSVWLIERSLNKVEAVYGQWTGLELARMELNDIKNNLERVIMLGIMDLEGWELLYNNVVRQYNKCSTKISEELKTVRQ